MLAAALAACASGPPPLRTDPGERSLVASHDEGSATRIDARDAPGRPHLAVLTRDGDPAPAVAVTFVTSVGPVETTALAGVIESRLRAAGVALDVRVDRDAFTLRTSLHDGARAAPLFATIIAATTTPIAAGSPELALATQRLESLRRNPIDDGARGAIVACTGALGVRAADVTLDPASPAGASALEAARRALDVTRIAVGAAAPAKLGAAISRAWEAASGWPVAAPPPASPDAWPAADVVHAARGIGPRTRLTVAARVADPSIAAAAGGRLASPDGVLASRLHSLSSPWRIAEVTGVARPSGGCVALELEPAPEERAPSAESVAFVASIVRREIGAEVARGAPHATVAHQILGANDPRDAAALAAWWSLAGSAPGAPTRWITDLVRPASRTSTDTDASASDGGFASELARLGASNQVASTRVVTVERGQGELWMLLASPCGVAEEGNLDAGLGALAILASTETRRRLDGVTVEPWITADGLGVVAHAAARDDRETASDLAERVANAAAETLTATTPSAEAFRTARFTALDHLERAGGEGGLAFAALSAAATPDHPSWLDPFGVAARVSGASPEAVRLRSRALALGPLRVAVLANVDPAQGAAAADAVDRWLGPTGGPRQCRGAAPSAPHAGRAEVRTSDATLAQALLGLPLPGPSWRALGELTAIELDGPNGFLASAAPDAWISARVEGGGRVPLLVVDVRAGADTLPTAAAAVKAALLRLPAATEQDFARALATWDERASRNDADPRSRLIDLWTSRPPQTRPTYASWRAYLATTVREASLVIVETRSATR